MAVAGSTSAAALTVVVVVDLTALTVAAVVDLAVAVAAAAESCWSLCFGMAMWAMISAAEDEVVLETDEVVDEDEDLNEPAVVAVAEAAVVDAPTAACECLDWLLLLLLP